MIPGPDGWELWQGTREQGFRRTLADGPQLASEMGKIPSGPLVMGFPVREAIAIPFKAQTDDESMFEDLAEMQLEKIGVRSEPDAGRLTDVFPVGRDNGETTLLSVVLAPPVEGSMPPKAPKEFDISARLYPMEDRAVTLWCELGRWVFAVTRGGCLTYFQSLPGTGVTADAVRDVKLALNQLKLQGVGMDVNKVIVWTSGRELDPDQVIVTEFGKGLGMPIEFGERPSPVLPRPMSKLVPADVRAEQRLKAERLKRNWMIAAIAMMYLGLAAYLGNGYWQLSESVKKQEQELESIRIAHGEIGIFNDGWDQLAPVVDDRHWPLMALKRCADIIPLGKDLRFKVFEAKVGEINIQGEAADNKVSNAYASSLRRRMSDYEWNIPPAEADGKTTRRKFRYTGIFEGSDTEL